MSIWKPVLVTAAALTLGACATVPQPLKGNFNPVSPSAVQHSGASSAAQVRWGGQIIDTEPGQNETCFYMLSRPLDSSARPSESSKDDSAGRFVACHAGFYDPEVFTKGREVTFTGTLDGTVTRKVGSYDYVYPRLEASTVYLWPKRQPIRYRDPYYDPFYNPYFGPWGPWGWGYDPFWAPAPRVIYVRPVYHHHK
ncbi:Slp family lipoprotein [Oleiagrimonas sp. C23AA]|uniref:Slp family lipoprotein n=1 Tax=Oleiagrimonas sp. C23AA TaxID=2719047 RepID=UPI00141F848B|nr:Slp family lipoprotein [Oleiagrimonas sp. C23AA]NII10307.1 Slp/YeaY family lipoprotein [Oleiagrimonas sp. C23AA]